MKSVICKQKCVLNDFHTVLVATEQAMRGQHKFHRSFCFWLLLGHCSDRTMSRSSLGSLCDVRPVSPCSQTGKKLMAKCRMLIQENQELGRQLSQGRIAQLEAELALQKKYSEELKSSQDGEHSSVSFARSSCLARARFFTRPVFSASPPRVE